MELPITRIPESIHKFRGVTPSEEFTKFFKDAAEDIEKLFVIINENKEKLKNIESISNIENRFLFDKLLELEELLVQKDIQLMAGNEKYHIINTRNILPDTTIPVSVSNEFNQVIPNKCNFISKLYIKDEILGKNVMPPSLRLDITQRTSPIINASAIVITENDPKLSVDGNSNTCWQRKVEIPKQYNANYVEVDIIIPIVNEIISNRKINTISINPHPVRGVDIINIEALYEDMYLQIPGFMEHSQYNNDSLCIKDSGPIRFYFHDIMPTSFKITIRQSKSIEEGDNDVFYLGAYSIDIGYTKCLSNISGFVAQVELLSNNNLLTNVVAKLDNKTLVGDVINYEIYYLNELNELVLLTDSFDLEIVIPSNKLVIIGKIINSDTNIIPTINSIKVEYNLLT